MTTPEEWMTIKTLSKKGLSQRKIARTLGISRNTVKRYLTEEHPPHYHRESPYPTILDDYLDYLAGRLKAYPTLTADRLYRELLERGYSGSYETVARYIRNHLSRKEVHAYERFENTYGRRIWIIQELYTIAIYIHIKNFHCFVINRILE